MKQTSKDTYASLYNFFTDDVVKLKSAEGVASIAGVNTYKDININGTYRILREDRGDGNYTLVELTTNKVKHIMTNIHNIILVERNTKPVIHRESNINRVNLADFGKEVYEF